VCFVLILFQLDQRYPLVIAANRNESRGRPAALPHRWPGEPPLWAGRDEVAGGTWLGVNAHGLLVALTNRRNGGNDPTLPSRGQLCLEALRQASPAAALSYVQEALRVEQYNPFNLLAASPRDGWVINWRGEVWPLTPGAHVLTNEGDVDDRRLPMIARGFVHAATLEVPVASLEALLQPLGRICADTEEPDAICRPGGETGTVSSSLIALGADGAVAAYWHADGPPSEVPYAPISIEDGPVH
jgi:uncharacterized protein with NRDE domain